MSSRTSTLSPTDPENWKRLMNFLFIHEQDALFEWLRSVRAAVEEVEKEAAA